LADALYFEPWESVLKAVQSKVAAGRIARFIHRIYHLADRGSFLLLSYLVDSRPVRQIDETSGYPSRLAPRTLLSAVWTFLHIHLL